MTGVGIIGYGYWGPNLVRNFSELDDSQVVAVSDFRMPRLTLAQKKFPGISVTTDYHDLLDNPAIDAVAIATPVSSHFDIAMAALAAGKHVLVEKPLTRTSEEAETLVREAHQRQLTLMVDHTFIYMGAVQKISDLINSGELGDIYYYDATRVNLGLFQHDINVIYDLAVHDLSIMDYLFHTMRPVAVSASGKSHLAGQPENIAYLTLYFDANFIAHINVNWLSPVKLRQTLIGGSKKMIVFDDLEVTEKVKVYNSGITVNSHPEDIYKTMVGYRMGDICSPFIDQTEALQVVARHFIDCIVKKETPRTNGEMGLRIVKILEAACQSLKEHGRPIEVDL